MKTRREGDIRRFRAKREQEIADVVRIAHARQIQSDANFRESVGLQLGALGKRVGTAII